MVERDDWKERDSEAVQRYLSGEARAFTELHDRYRGPMINFAYRIVKDKERAEDLVQEAWIRMYRHMHRFDQSRRFSTWAYAILANPGKNELRDQGRNPIDLISTIETPGWRPMEWSNTKLSTERTYEERHLEEVVDKTISLLPDHFRAVFYMRERLGMTYEEIQEVLDVTMGTVKSRLHRARVRFSELFKVNHPEEYAHQVGRTYAEAA